MMLQFQVPVPFSIGKANPDLEISGSGTYMYWNCYISIYHIHNTGTKQASDRELHP